MKKKSKKLKIFLISLIIIIIIIIIFIFADYQSIITRNQNLVSTIQNKTDISINKIHQTAIRNSLKEWSLDAGSVNVISAKNKAILKNLFITFYLKDEEKVYLTADHGVLKRDSNDIEVAGNVVVKNKSLKLLTEKLNYENKSRIIKIMVPLKIAGDSFNLLANSMVFDLNTDIVVFEGNVKGTFSENFIF